MNKYLEKLNENELLGKKINTKDGDYTILFSKKEGEFLDILLVDVEDAQKNSNNKEQLSVLKEMLKNIDYDCWHDNSNKIWRLRYAEVRIANPLLRNCKGHFNLDCTEKDFYVRVSDDGKDALDDFNFPGRKEENEIINVKDVYKELSQIGGLIAGLRKLFSQRFNVFYDLDLKNYYFNLAKKNNEDMISESQEQINFFTRKMQSNKENIKVLEEADEAYTDFEI